MMYGIIFGRKYGIGVNAEEEINIANGDLQQCSLKKTGRKKMFDTNPIKMTSGTAAKGS